MPNGIIIFGANGSGKTTLGRELSHILNYKHMDVEDYYFEESEIPYSKPRLKKDVINLMLTDIEKYGSFVLSGVTGDYGDMIISMVKLAVCLSVPLEARIERINRRSEEKYGGRVLAGGDMYEQELKFVEFVKTRNLSLIDEWAKTLKCPVLYLDGTKQVSENIKLIVEQFSLI